MTMQLTIVVRQPLTHDPPLHWRQFIAGRTRILWSSGHRGYSSVYKKAFENNFQIGICRVFVFAAVHLSRGVLCHRLVSRSGR